MEIPGRSSLRVPDRSGCVTQVLRRVWKLGPQGGNMDRWRTFFAVVVLIGWGVVPGVAQIDRANLNGTVSDPSGASVPNAKVEVVSPNTGFRRQVETGDAGVYSIAGLPIGTYDLTISHDGFKTFEQKGISLLVGQTRTVNAQLEVGAAIQKVDVQSTVQALESANAELGGVVQSQQVQ